MISVFPAPWKEYSQRLLNLRTSVFVMEQHVPPELERDDWDELSYHVLVSRDNIDVATGRLLPDGHIGRVCVLDGFRRKGLGLLVMKALIQEAKDKGFEELILSSQVQAIKFYEKCGFEIVSDEFIEAGIPHREMKLNI